MTFIQLIEYDTTQKARVDELMDEWLATTEGKRTASHEMLGQDRDKPSHFVNIVEFPSYERAMANSNLPETQHIAEELASLCDGSPRFVNLDVIREERL
ncbi:hypothetical protein GCM10010193_39740 [Kitasatospora atroaurantiaca]|uniref:Quinol monooxygenase YgiN n=1 Tax=Kitasatospora atroaurantiaca TaxID=285545 RepID=A0A561EKW7_9ACTN|nr:hypothetical protein [Kitasatospora atroaurantiaca]TWE16251.1 hypothetical protein FB465_1228 [Kitasatospora atroaurantiaca]